MPMMAENRTETMIAGEKSFIVRVRALWLTGLVDFERRFHPVATLLSDFEKNNTTAKKTFDIFSRGLFVSKMKSPSIIIMHCVSTLKLSSTHNRWL